MLPSILNEIIFLSLYDHYESMEITQDVINKYGNILVSY